MYALNPRGRLNVWPREAISSTLIQAAQGAIFYQSSRKPSSSLDLTVSDRLLVIGQEGRAEGVSVCGLLCQERDWQVEQSSWGALAFESLERSPVDLVVAMAVCKTERTVRFFRWLRDNPVASGTLAVLPTEADAEIMRASLEAVDDFVLWPAGQEELRYRVTRLLRAREKNTAALGERLSVELGMEQLVGIDPAFVQVLRRIPALAHSEAPVLITGETGTGKEMFAQALHHVGRRRNYPLIPVDCTGLPHQLFENELFGHQQGAFTDARRTQKGLVAMAEGGSLFLDEVNALDLRVQAKLLRFLQDGMYKPLGADRFVRSDVRVIAACNCDVETLVSEGQFRSDLYYRLNVLRLELPPLRRRRGDIAELARHFLTALCPPAGAARKSFTPAALRKLACYDWPGNVRELYNVVQRAFVFADGPQILPCHISIPVPEAPAPSESAGRFREARARTIEAFERQYVEEMIRKHNGNVTKAANEAGKERRAFGRMIKKYGINRVRSDPSDGS